MVSWLVRRLCPVRSRSVAGCGGRETIAVLQSIAVGRGELQPTLNASIVLVDLGDTLERFVVGVDQELRGPES